MRNALYALLAVAFAMSALLMTSQGASAAAQSLPSIQLKDIANSSPTTNVQYSGHCVRRYFTCRHRYGGGFDFRACMRWRGCWGNYQGYRGRNVRGCGYWRRQCGENWGWDNNDFYGCLRYHGC